MSIDWQKFYRLLDRTRVEIPEPDAADPAQLQDMTRLLAKVSNYRMTLDRTMRKIERRLGSVRNDIEIHAERLRIERAEARFDRGILDGCNNEKEREAMIDLHTRNTAAKLTVLKGHRQQLDHARSAIDATQSTLKGAKETLNGIRQTILAELEMNG